MLILYLQKNIIRIFIVNRTEHDEQVALFRWMKAAHPKLIMFSIPNAAKRSPQLANYMKAEGLLAGVADLFLMKPIGKYHGLFIEMKAAKGKVSDQQAYFIEQANLNGYKAIVCFGFDEAHVAITNYLHNV